LRRRTWRRCGANRCNLWPQLLRQSVPFLQIRRAVVRHSDCPRAIFPDQDLEREIDGDAGSGQHHRRFDLGAVAWNCWLGAWWQWTIFENGGRSIGFAKPLSQDEPEQTEGERIDAMDFVARVLVQIPDPRRHSVRYYGVASRAPRGPEGGARRGRGARSPLHAAAPGGLARRDRLGVGAEAYGFLAAEPARTRAMPDTARASNTAVHSFRSCASGAARARGMWSMNTHRKTIRPDRAAARRAVH
jgi:hypothetical protein